MQAQILQAVLATTAAFAAHAGLLQELLVTLILTLTSEQLQHNVNTLITCLA